MARRWTTASSQYVSVSPGALAGVHGFGTIVAMFRRASTGGTQNLVWTGTNNNAGSTGLSLDLGGSDNLRMYAHDSGASSVGPAITATDRWYVAVARKGTGTVTASFSVFDTSTRTWSHSTGTGSVQNGEGTYNTVTIGSWTTAYDYQDGDMAALGVFRQWVPTDAEIEALGFLTVSSWLEAARRASAGAAVWIFDQAATTTNVIDWTGGGANQSGGTLPSVSALSVPLLSYGAPILVSSIGSAGPTVVTGVADATLVFAAPASGTVTGPDTDWLNPASDVTTNSWINQAAGTTNLYQSIDEDAPASDADYIVSPEGATAGSYYETALEVQTGDAGLSTHHVVAYRATVTTTSPSDLTVSLRQGAGTEIAAWTHTDIPAAWGTATQTLSGAQADAITYPTDLRLRFAPTAEPATISLVADRGSVQDLTAATSVVCDLPAGGSIAAGNWLIARVAVDNTGASGARPGLTVTDARNTWTVGTGGLQDPGAASAGTACYIAVCGVVNPYSNGDDVTFSWTTGSPAAKAIVIEEWFGINGVAAAETQAQGGTTAFSIASGAATAVGQLVYGVCSVEGPTGDSFPTDADLTPLTRLSTTSGTAAANQTVNGAYRISTAAEATTWNGTLGATRDWAAAMVVLAPAPTRIGVSWAGMQIPAGAPTVFGTAADTFTFDAPAVGSKEVFGTALAAAAFDTSATGTRTNVGATAATDLVFAGPAAGAPERSGTATFDPAFSAPAIGTPDHPGTAADAFVFDAPAVGTRTITGTATFDPALTATADGTRIAIGSTATFDPVLSAPATGTRESTGNTAAAAFTFTATGDGSILGAVNGVATFDPTFAAPATGTKVVSGAATFDPTFAATGDGTVIAEVVNGTATFDPTLTATAVGTRTTFAAATFDPVFSATGTGSKEVFGSVADTFTTTTTAAGIREVAGTSTDSFAFTATGDGTVSQPGAGFGTVDFTFTAPATGTRVVTGTATFDPTLTATSTGTRTVVATSLADFTLTATAAGAPERFGSTSDNYIFNATSTGSSFAAGTGAADAAFTLTAPAVGTRTVLGVADAALVAITTAAGTRDVPGLADVPLAFSAPASGSVTVSGVASITVDFAAPAAGAGFSLETGTAATTFTFNPTGQGLTVGPQFFPYHRFAEHLLQTIEAGTGRAAYLTFVTEGLPDQLSFVTRPTEPYTVLHLFGPTGPKDRAMNGRAVTLSFYIQVDGIGRTYHDAMWVLDRSVQAIRDMSAPTYVNGLIVNARSSPFEINSEALRALAQRLSVRLTRAS